jgi:hypothetical protein
MLSNTKKDETDVDKLVAAVQPVSKELTVEPKQLQPFQHLVSEAL